MKGTSTATAIALSLLSLFSHAAPNSLVSQRNATSERKSGSGDSMGPVLSRDGRFVVFASTAPDLLPAQSSVSAWPVPDVLSVYLRDRLSGQTMLISSNLSGVETGTTSVTPVGLSPDNRYVLLETGSMAGAPTALTLRSDVWLLDRSTGTKTLISVNTNGAPSIGRADSATLTPDGRYVAFVSSANDLVLGDTNGITDIFVRDTQLGTTVLASPGATGGTAGSREPFMSADGRYVLFFSAAQGLTPASTPPGDIYLRDTVAGTTLLVSTNGRSFAGASASACNQSVLIPISTDFEKSHIGAIGSVL